MGLDRLERVLAAELETRAREERLKERESVIVGIVPACEGRGPRFA